MTQLVLHDRSLHLGRSLILIWLLAATGVQAQAAPAQPPEPASEAAPPEAAGAPAEAAAEPPDAPVAATATDDSGEPGDATIAALEARIAALESRAEEAEMEALLGDDASAALAEEPTLRIYGFADFGFQRSWTDPSTIVANFIEANAASFVVGNLNLYFDAKPAEQWRTLIEVRFTNAPHGLINSPGGLAGTFDREDTYQIDPHGSGLNVPMWRGSMVLERAWTEWQAHQLLNIRIGNYFTPWGIWNIDHGSPTLITLTLPQSILQYIIPIRQTGLQVYGSTFLDDWQLGYHLTLSNGRNEISNFDFDDGKAFGGRVFARRELGTFNLTLGASAYAGSQSDEIVDLVALSPLAFEQYSSWSYDEELLGFDVALDIDDFRLRSEVTIRNRRYDPNKLKPIDPIFVPPGYAEHNRVGYWGYIILAQRLPFWGLEPYLYVDGQHSQNTISDTVLIPAVGLNVHFTPSTQVKLTYSQSFLLKLTSGSDELVGHETDGVRTLMARVVTAF